MPSTSFISTAAVLLAAVRLASAGSKLTIKNSCSETISIDKCQFSDNWLPDVPPGQSSEPQEFDSTSGGTGVSYKITPQSQKDAKPMQFEYSSTANNGGYLGQQIWFDLSNIDGYPQMFVDGGVTITPKGEGSNCQPILCPAGERKCKNAYNVWDDDQKAMRNCGDGCEIEVEVCSGGQSSNGGGSSGSSSGSDSGSDSGSSGSDNSGSSGSQQGAPAYGGGSSPSTTLVTSASAAPSAQSYNQNQNQNQNMVKMGPNGNAYVDNNNQHGGQQQQQQDQNGNIVYVTQTTQAIVTETAAAPHYQHRRHAHGHAHHHA